MSATILQVNFTFHSTRAEYEAACEPLAAPLASMPGLGWKVWLMNERDQEGGGIYCFTDATAATAFRHTLEGMLGANPDYSNLSIKQFGVLDALTAVTRGPIPPASGAVTFGQMAAAAAAVTPALSPAAVQERYPAP